jgi:hypothetical protein
VRQVNAYTKAAPTAGSECCRRGATRGRRRRLRRAVPRRRSSPSPGPLRRHRGVRHGHRAHGAVPPHLPSAGGPVAAPQGRLRARHLKPLPHGPRLRRARAPAACRPACDRSASLHERPATRAPRIFPETSSSTLDRKETPTRFRQRVHVALGPSCHTIKSLASAMPAPLRLETHLFFDRVRVS